MYWMVECINCQLMCTHVGVNSCCLSSKWFLDKMCLVVTTTNSSWGSSSWTWPTTGGCRRGWTRSCCPSPRRCCCCWWSPASGCMAKTAVKEMLAENLHRVTSQELILIIVCNLKVDVLDVPHVTLRLYISCLRRWDMEMTAIDKPALGQLSLLVSGWRNPLTSAQNQGQWRGPLSRCCMQLECVPA